MNPMVRLTRLVARWARNECLHLEPLQDPLRLWILITRYRCIHGPTGRSAPDPVPSRGQPPKPGYGATSNHTLILIRGR